MNQFKPIRETVRTGAAMLAACALFAAGCAGMNLDARETLQASPECGQSVEELKASRANGFKRFTQGVQAIAPPMIVLSGLRDLLIGKPYRSVYLDHWRVAFGAYNDRIDKRVEYLQACGM